MNYLTVHDLVWINTSVTGKVNAYDYAPLESAIAGQYAYGESKDVQEQAATLLRRLMDKPPFSEGNRRTAFIATLTFLNANEYATKVQDEVAANIFLSTERGDHSAELAVAALVSPAKGTLPAGLTLRKLITHECNQHLEALKSLSEGD